MNPSVSAPSSHPLDNPERFLEIRQIVERKPALKKIYEEVYGKYSSLLSRCPSNGVAIELGSGAGMAKDYVPGILTTDILPYPGLDMVFDATRMPLEDQSVRAILMWNVFHHIPDAKAFLTEVNRCLVPGGRLLMVEPYPGWIGSFVYKYLHHEPFDPKALEWKFESSGPVSDANGALPWIVFERDRKKFSLEFPALKIARFEPNTPLRYWLAGGLKKWSLLPGSGFGLATALDNCLSRALPRVASFVDIELLKEG